MPSHVGGSPRKAGRHTPLAGSPLLASISSRDLQDLVAEARPRSWAAGQLLFQRGDEGDGLYAIVSGHVRIVLEGVNGAEVIVRQLGPGEVFGELSALDGAPRSASAIAATPVRALHISTARFAEWFGAHPGVALPMLTWLVHRLRTTNDQVAEIGLLDVETRIARRLWQHFSDATGGGTVRPGSRVRITQRELASELGITRESVNKHLARWKAKRVIEVDNGAVVLLDGAALKRATGVL